MNVDLLMSEALPTEVQDEVAAGFRQLGCATTVRSLGVRRGAAEVAWLVIATFPLEAFLHGMATAAGEDLFKRLRDLLGRLARAKSAQSKDARLLVLRDPATRLEIVLEDDLPLAAFQQLTSLDLSTFTRGPLHYDRQREKWRSELDEWDRQSSEH